MTIGDDEQYCWSIIVDDAVDPDGPRTNQRAEVLAAIEGLKLLDAVNQLQAIHKAMGQGDSHHKPASRHTDGPRTYIVVADSEYVVKGITEWFPTWRVRLSYLTSQIAHEWIFFFTEQGLAYGSWKTTHEPRLIFEAG
jgi:ribonuclease HI